MLKRTRDVSRIPCASGTRAAHLPGERDDFASLICDFRQKRYTQSVRPPLRQAVNVSAHGPFCGKRYLFFRYLSANIARSNARGRPGDVDEEAKNIREAQAGGNRPLSRPTGKTRAQAISQ